MAISILAMISLLATSSITDDFLNVLSNELPRAIGAIIIILVGIVIGWGVGKIADRVVDRTVEKNFDKSRVGQSFRLAGFDLSKFVGGVLYAFVIIVAIA